MSGSINDVLIVLIFVVFLCLIGFFSLRSSRRGRKRARMRRSSKEQINFLTSKLEELPVYDESLARQMFEQEGLSGSINLLELAQALDHYAQHAAVGTVDDWTKDVSTQGSVRGMMMRYREAGWSLRANQVVELTKRQFFVRIGKLDICILRNGSCQSE